jgi:peroxin-2
MYSCLAVLFCYFVACRTLTERLLGARLVYKQPNMSRLISFEYLNRQLVWQELSEFLLFLLPLINVAKVKRFILKLLPRVPLVAAGGVSDGGSGGVGSAAGQYPLAGKEWSSSSGWQEGDLKQQQQQQDEQQEDSKSNPQQQEGLNSSSSSRGSGSTAHRAAAVDLLRPLGPCPICGVHEMLVPFVAYPCRHVFCYYCLRSHTEADQGFCCPVDGQRVDSMQRYAVRAPS